MKLRIGAPGATLAIWLLAWGGAASSARAQVEAAGDHHTCAWFANEVKCWGLNNSGQLGQGDTVTRGDGAGEMGASLSFIDLGATTLEQVAAGSYFTCALMDGGSVKCWGDNTAGQLGQGDTSDRGDGASEMGANLLAVDLGTRPSGLPREVKQITAGALHACALFDNGQVKCWGHNAYGQLGLGDTASRGDGAGEMGNNLAIVKLGTDYRAKHVSAGSFHTCAVLDTDEVKCWGHNAYGQLGLGDTANRGDAAGEMGNNLPAVDLGAGRTAKTVVAASLHTCALLDDDSVKCWGRNDDGELGLGDTSNRGDAAGEMGNALPAIDLGTGRTATRIAAGGDHTCAVLDTGGIKCWGHNGEGELGLGDVADRGDAASEMGEALPEIDLGTGRTALYVVAGLTHTCALLDNLDLKCWGFNLFGQLGLGDIATRGDGPGEMGEALPEVEL